jgi:hypothetical protein
MFFFRCKRAWQDLFDGDDIRKVPLTECSKESYIVNQKRFAVIKNQDAFLIPPP